MFRAHVDFVIAHPGVPRFIFHELQQPADSAAKSEVRAVLQGYRKLLLGHLKPSIQSSWSAPTWIPRPLPRLHRPDPGAGDAVDADSGRPAAMRRSRTGSRPLPARPRGSLMKLSSIGMRRSSWAAGRACWLALAFVVMRSGPLAPTRVTVVQAAEGQLTPALFGIGTVEARRSYLIGPTVAGRVRKVPSTSATLVKAGQLLAEMDPVDLDERTAALDASVARAGSAMARGCAAPRRPGAQANWRPSTRAAMSNWAAELHQRRRRRGPAAGAGVGRRGRHRGHANLAAARQDHAAPGGRAGRPAPAARQRAPAGALPTAWSSAAMPTRVDRGGRAGRAAVIEPSSLWVKVRLDQGRSAGLAVGLPAQMVLRSNPGQRPRRQGGARRSRQRQRDRRARRPGELRPAAPAGLSVGELAEVTLSLPATAPAVLLPNAAIRRCRPQVGVWTIDGGDLRFTPVRTRPDQPGRPGAGARGRAKPVTTSSCTAKRTSAPQPHHGRRRTLAGQQP
jgi:HlyD family secretion protein